MVISNLILVIGGCLILAVTSQLLYFALWCHKAQSKDVLMVYGGTALGFLIGFMGSIRFLHTKWEDGSFMWNFVITWALALIGFFGTLSASSKLSRKTHR